MKDYIWLCSSLDVEHSTKFSLFHPEVQDLSQSCENLSLSREVRLKMVSGLCVLVG